MVVLLSPERQAELLAMYKARKAKIEAENQAYHDMQAKARVEREAYFQLDVVQSTKKPHVCELCSATIPTGSQAKKRSVQTGTGWPFYLVTKYRHVGACPK